MEVAAFLGCNPIILTGMDLAYTDNSRYALGVNVHPADDRKEQEALTKKRGDSIAVPGVYEELVYTKPEWFLESIYIAEFKLRHPHITLINATEGGMPIGLSPDLPLKQAFEQHVNNFFDYEGLIHGSIQNALKTRVRKKDIQEVLKEWKRSLKRCLKLISEIEKALHQNQRRLRKGDRLQYGPYTGQASLWQVELEEESAYEFLLKTFSIVYETINKLQWLNFTRLSQKKQINLKMIDFEIDRCFYLKNYLQDHLKAIRESEIFFASKKICYTIKSTCLSKKKFKTSS